MSGPLRRAFEDFVPISDSEALITTGPRIDSLDRCEIAPYALDAHGGVVLHRWKGVLHKGAGIRLGGYHDGQLLYSTWDGGVFLEHTAVTAWQGKPIPRSAHQPTVGPDGALYYTDHWPYVEIHRNGEPFLTHFGPMVQVSNPCFGDGYMYFECRDTTAPDRPDAWRIYRCPQDRPDAPTYVREGANPAYLDGRLFWGEWDRRTRRFNYRSAPV